MGQERDLIGYAGNPPLADWPDGARLAVNFCVNYEEGAEYCLLNGDEHHETLLSDFGEMPHAAHERHLNIESAYEYGSRVGFWRILEVFENLDLPFTVNAVGLALEQNPLAAEKIAAANCDIQCHGWRWIDYHSVPEEVEREHIRRCVAGVLELTGERPIGWYTGRPSPNTRRLVVEDSGFLYDSDSYNDDLPYWTNQFGRPHLILPYSLDTNDSSFTRALGFSSPQECLQYWRDTVDRLLREGAKHPKMMTIGLHGRIIGRPGRIGALEAFLDYLSELEDVWICRRGEIARHWVARHPFDIKPARRKLA